MHEMHTQACFFSWWKLFLRKQCNRKFFIRQIHFFNDHFPWQHVPHLPSEIFFNVSSCLFAKKKDKTTNEVAENNKNITPFIIRRCVVFPFCCQLFAEVQRYHKCKSYNKKWSLSSRQENDFKNFTKLNVLLFFFARKTLKTKVMWYDKDLETQSGDLYMITNQEERKKSNEWNREKNCIANALQLIVDHQMV